MNDQDIQFSVDEVRHMNHDGHAICGRCSKGPIHIGDTFDKILYIEVHKTPDEYVTVGTRVVGVVHLQVEQIHAYGHDFDMLDHGVTAEIIVSGSGGRLLKIGQSIGGIKRVEQGSLTGEGQEGLGGES